MKHFSGAIVAIAVTLSVGSPGGIAQTSSATISGHVVDQTQGIVTNAQVKLINEQTGVIVTTQVLGNGDFIFPDVQPGTFTVEVQAPGFKALRKTNLTMSASQNLSAGSFVLEVGTVSQTISVSGAITPLQTTSSERSGVLDTQQLDNLLAIGRDAMSMVRTMPGVVMPAGGSEGASSLSTTPTPTVNGVNSEYNLATLDGVTGNTRGLNTLDTPMNLDAIKEVTVLGSNYQAAFGIACKNGATEKSVKLRT